MMFRKHLNKTRSEGETPMAGAINVRDLDSEDVEIVEKLVERLREKARMRKIGASEANGFRRSAGSWKGLVDGEELKRNIYENRLVSTRPVVKL
jgi:hypothetical protein